MNGGDMMLEQLLLQGAILLFCAVVQSAVGFAFSLFSNSLLLLAGLALPETVMLSTMGSVMQRSLMLVRLRAHVPWRITLPLSGVCLLALPLGVYVLKLLSLQRIDVAKAWLGGLMLLVLVVQVCWKVKPRAHLHAGWGALAAALSGIFTGLGNIGGPPLLLWIHAHDWPNEKTRVTAMGVTIVLVPVQLGLMFYAFGLEVLPSVSQFMILVPAVLLGTSIGMSAGRRLSRPHLRMAALSLLAVICVVCILDPML